MPEPGVNAIEVPAPVIAGFWRRLGAFIIDVLLLGAIGIVLGLLFSTQFAALGAWGRAVGFIIATAYFGWSESRRGGGRSLGKKVMGLAVVTRTGAALSTPKSVARAAIFCLAYFLNGASLGATAGREWLILFQSVLIIGLVIGVFYLLVFNRRTRQSLHDLAVGAYVVKAGPGMFALPALPVWRGHFVIVGVTILALSGAGMLLLKQHAMAALVATQQAVSALPGIDRVSVVESVNMTGETRTHRLLISAFVDAEATPDAEVVALQVAQAALNNAAGRDARQEIVVTILSGYDIGIASGSRWESFGHTATQWRALASKRSA